MLNGGSSYTLPYIVSYESYDRIISLVSTEYWQCVCVTACFVSGGAKVTNRLQDRGHPAAPAFGEGNEVEMNCCRWGLYHAAS